MPDEPNRKMDELLKSYAKKRRADAGAPLELHPATRRMLQSEVARLRPERTPASRRWIHSLTRFWPIIGFSVSILVALGLVSRSINQRTPREAQFAKAGDKPAGNRFAAERDQAAQDAPALMPPTKGAAARSDEPAAGAQKMPAEAKGVPTFAANGRADMDREKEEKLGLGLKEKTESKKLSEPRFDNQKVDLAGAPAARAAVAKTARVSLADKSEALARTPGNRIPSLAISSDGEGNGLLNLGRGDEAYVLSLTSAPDFGFALSPVPVPSASFAGPLLSVAPAISNWDLYGAGRLAQNDAGQGFLNFAPGQAAAGDALAKNQGTGKQSDLRADGAAKRAESGRATTYANKEPSGQLGIGGFGGGGGGAAATATSGKPAGLAAPSRGVVSTPQATSEKLVAAVTPQRPRSEVEQISTAAPPLVRQRFKQVADDSNPRNVRRAGGGQKVLASFDLEQNGDRIRIFDADGSIYEGQLGGNNADARSKDAQVRLTRAGKVESVNLGALQGQADEKKRRLVGAEQTNGQSVSFQASGTNLSLNQLIVIDGNFTSAVVPGAPDIPGQTPALRAGSSSDAQNSLSQAVGFSRLTCNARIGTTNQVEINAQRVGP
jgi:hypothetical protein